MSATWKGFRSYLDDGDSSFSSLIEKVMQPEPQAFNEKGEPIPDNNFHLEMSQEAIDFAIADGWERETIYRKDQSGELVPQIVFKMPELDPEGLKFVE